MSELMVNKLEQILDSEELSASVVEDINEIMESLEQQAQTIKELQDQLQAKTEECDGLRAQVNELRDWVDGVRIRYQNIPPENGVEQREFDAAMETLKRTPVQSLSAIRNEAIREGWDMAIDACLCARLPTSVFSDDDAYKTAILNYSNAIRNLPYPQLTEKE